MNIITTAKTCIRASTLAVCAIAISATLAITSPASAQTGSHIKGGNNQPGRTLWMSEPNAIRNVRKQLERGENERALRTAEAFIAKLEMALSQEDPLLDYFAYNAYCVALNANSRHADAIDACEKAIKIAPNRWQAYNNRGTVYLVTGYAGKAIADYSKALELEPSEKGAAATIRHNLALARVEN